MIEALLLMAAVATLWLTGVAIVTMLLWLSSPDATLERTEVYGLAIVFGVGGVSWLLFVVGLYGGAIGRETSVGIGVLGVALGGAALWMIRGDRRIVAAPVDSFARAARGGVLVLWVLLLVQTLLTPQRLWDERAIFGIKAAVLFEDGTLHSDALMHPQFSQYHPRYPLLLPLAEANIYGWMGRVDDRWGKIIPPLLALGLWLTFAGALSRRWGSGRGWLWALLLASVPALTTWEYGFLSAQGDAVVGVFHGVSVLYLWELLRGGGRFPALAAGLAASCALFTKDEGIALLLVDLIAWGLVIATAALLSTPEEESILRRLGGVVRSIAFFLALVALLGVVWFRHRRWLPSTTEMSYFHRLNWQGLQDGIETLAWSLPHMGRRMFREATTWGLVWWGVLVAALMRPRLAIRPPQAFLLLDILGAITALLVAGMLAPTPVEEHLGGSAHRFLLQVIPAGVLFVSEQCGSSGVDDG